MNEESRDKKKIFEIISKNRLIFVLVGSVIAIIAFFMPMFRLEEYRGPPANHWVLASLWIFGLYDESIVIHQTEWFGLVEEQKLGVAIISIASTIIIGLLVLGTIFNVSKTLIKNRKKREQPSRLFLWLSIGLFAVVNLYMFVLSVFVFENYSLSWVNSPIYVFRLGAILFFIGSILILLGYTVKLRPMLQIFSLFVAGGLIHYGALNLTYFFWYLSIAMQPIDPVGVLFQFNRVGIPAIIAVSIALVIVVVNYVLYRRAKKRAPIIKSI